MFFCENLVNYLEHLQILPMGNVRHFRRIPENDILFLKMYVFCEKKSVNLCVFIENCAFFVENSTEISRFRRNLVICGGFV